MQSSSKLRIVLAAVAGVALAGSASMATAAVHNTAIVTADSTLNLSLMSVQQRYKEYPLTASDANHEHGSLFGGAFDASSLQPTGLYSRFRIGLMAGDTHYVGHITSTGAVATGTTKNRVANIDLDLGWGFGLGSRAALIPYGGFDLHAWGRTLSYNTPSQYTELYHEMDLGAGVIGQYSVTPKLVLGANLFTGRVIHATMTSELPALYGGTQTYNQGKAPVDRVSVMADYALFKRVHLFARVTYYHLAFGQSNILSDGSYEPASRTNEVTYEAGLGLHI